MTERLQQVEVTLKYRNGICIDPEPDFIVDNSALAMTFTAELMNLGFMPTAKLFEALSLQGTILLGNLYKYAIPALKHRLGADVVHKPMYPNFPKQVVEASEFELFVDQVIHYMSMGTWLPDYPKLDRPDLFEKTDYKFIDLLEPKDLYSIFTNLVGSNDSISQGDKDTIEWFMTGNYHLEWPEEIPFKENLCHVVSIMIKDKNFWMPEAVTERLEGSKCMKTSTDVLRVLTAMSDGDISLAENTKFKSQPRRVRKWFCEILERVGRLEDYKRHQGKWVRLFHSLHVGDFSKKVYEHAKYIRENKHIETFQGKVQKLIDLGKMADASEVLKDRPGEFVRRLDHMLRECTPPESLIIVRNFITVCDKIPTRVLLQAFGHLRNRMTDTDRRFVFPKGQVQKCRVLRNTVKALHHGAIAPVLYKIEDVIKERFGDLGIFTALDTKLVPEEPDTYVKAKVWVDPALKLCPLPTAQRSASDGLVQVARGTRLPIGDKEALRLFIYWKGQDIDLSATFHNEKFQKVGHVSYTNYREAAYKAYYSGDITRAPNGASEFIDIDIEQAYKNGARYVAMCVYVFNGPNFDEHEICYAGWMTRDDVNSGEIYEPKTVQQKVDLTSKSRNAIPVIFDLKERKAIWCDLSTNSRHADGGNNVESNQASIAETLEAIVTMDNKVSLYDLFMWHAEMRGEIVDRKEDADMYFSMYNGNVTPFNIDVINSEYLV